MAVCGCRVAQCLINFITVSASSCTDCRGGSSVVVDIFAGSRLTKGMKVSGDSLNLLGSICSRGTSLILGEGALGGTLKLDDIFVRVTAGRLADTLTPLADR